LNGLPDPPYRDARVTEGFRSPQQQQMVKRIARCPASTGRADRYRALVLEQSAAINAENMKNILRRVLFHSGKQY
jgi:hypothetical protein